MINFLNPFGYSRKKPKLNQLRDDVTLHKFINSLTLYYQSHFMCSHKSENYTVQYIFLNQQVCRVCVCVCKISIKIIIKNQDHFLHIFLSLQIHTHTHTHILEVDNCSDLRIALETFALTPNRDNKIKINHLTSIY